MYTIAYGLTDVLSVELLITASAYAQQLSKDMCIEKLERLNVTRTM